MIWHVGLTPLDIVLHAKDCMWAVTPQRSVPPVTDWLLLLWIHLQDLAALGEPRSYDLSPSASTVSNESA